MAQTDEKLHRYRAALSTYKSSLEHKIEEEMKKLMPCTLTLQQLKKQRLHAKDGMAALCRKIESSNTKTAT